jgi:hypothetical protein
MSATATKPNPGAPVATEMRQRAQEFARSLGMSHYREAIENGETLSAFLERQMPQSEYNDRLDAFQRLLMLQGIRVRSVEGELGIRASRFEDFFKSEHTRALLPEWWRREYRRGQGLPVNTRNLYTSQDMAPGSILQPWADNQTPRVNLQIAPAIPIRELIAIETSIDGDAYRMLYMTDSAANQRKVRVAEGAEIPKVKLSQGENVLRLYKYGRALETTYEQLRRLRIDRVAFHIQRMAVQAEIDKLDALLDVLVLGDGNANTAALSHNLTTLDAAASAGTATLKGWLAYKMKFANPYMLTHILVQEAVALQLFLLNVGSANLPVTSLPSQAVRNITAFEPINPGLADGTRMGWTTGAPTLKIVGFDRRFAIERVSETGATIQEVERVITNQTQVVTMTEVEGYGKIDQNSTRILDVNA